MFCYAFHLKTRKSCEKETIDASYSFSKAEFILNDVNAFIFFYLHFRAEVLVQKGIMPLISEACAHDLVALVCRICTCVYLPIFLLNSKAAYRPKAKMWQLLSGSGGHVIVSGGHIIYVTLDLGCCLCPVYVYLRTFI